MTPVSAAPAGTGILLLRFSLFSFRSLQPTYTTYTSSLFLFLISALQGVCRGERHPENMHHIHPKAREGCMLVYVGCMSSGTTYTDFHLMNHWLMALVYVMYVAWG